MTTATTTASQTQGVSLFKGLGVTKSGLVMTAYIVFLMLPIYWLLNMSLKTNDTHDQD